MSPTDDSECVPVAAAVIVNNGEVLMVRRRVEEGELSWQFPAGKVEPGESGVDAAVREAQEEAGLIVRAVSRLGSRVHPATGQTMLYVHLRSGVPLRCTCAARLDDNNGIPWCTGDAYAFLTAKSSHYRRSNFSERIFRPAADGWYPQRAPHRSRMPVLVDHQHPWPGKPLPPWPAAQAAKQSYTPPQGRGRPRVTDDSRLASWLPIRPGLTPHGQRHGYHTWLDEDGVPYVAQSQQVGHEVPGMRGIYSHVTDRMLDEIREALQRRWLAALRARAALSPTSAVPVLDAALTALSDPRQPPPLEGFAPTSPPKSDT